MNDASLSPEDSLSLIRDMIDKTRRDISYDSFYFLLWGWLVIIICVVQFILLDYVHTSLHFLAWQLIWIGIIVSAVHGRSSRKKERVRTYVGEAMKFLWLGELITFFLLGFICGFETWKAVFPLYMMVYGLGTFVSGGLLRFRPLIIGGIICWAMALGSVFLPFDLQMLATALAILISYIIPGYLLRGMQNRFKSELSPS